MLRWSRRSIQRTTRAAVRCTISSRCNSVPVIPNNAAFPESSVEVTSACTSVLQGKSGRDDLIRSILRSLPYAVRHMRVTCVFIDIVESRYTPRSRMLADVLTSLPQMSMRIGDVCVIRFGAANSMTRAVISSSYIREESPMLSLSWWGWRSCYESVVLRAPLTPAASTAEAERRVAHSISCHITF